MGNSAGMYVDGDVPRDVYTSITGPGYAYYRSSISGRCEGCYALTNYWMVSIKANGKFWCTKCDEKQKAESKRKLEVYSRGYGTVKQAD